MTSSTVHRPPSARSAGLDALRTLAIAAMMAAHTSRMIEFDFRPAWAFWVLLLEPIIPSLFLLMVGVSLTYSFRRAQEKSPSDKSVPGAWYRKQARRAVVLWGIAVLFYVLELGPRFPDFVTANGILGTIAYAILGVGALLLLPKKEWVLSGALALGLALFIGLDLAGQRVFALNTGNAPFLPLWLFALAGALWSLLQRRFPRPVFWTGLAAAALAAWLIHRFGLHPLFTKPFGRSEAGRLLAPPLFIPGGERHVGYYNLRPLLALTCLGFHLGALSLLGILNNARGKVRARLSPLFILGRHSLEVYILHLSLLAVLVLVFGIRPLKTAASGSFVLFGVIATCLVIVFLLEKRKTVQSEH
jgi:uncharacterized membrane protein